MSGAWHTSNDEGGPVDLLFGCLLGPMIAAAAMSSVAVIGNALRLRRTRLAT